MVHGGNYIFLLIKLGGGREISPIEVPSKDECWCMELFDIQKIFNSKNAKTNHFVITLNEVIN